MSNVEMCMQSRHDISIIHLSLNFASISHLWSRKKAQRKMEILDFVRGEPEKGKAIGFIIEVMNGFVNV
jgi:hypothetical protein